MTASEHTSGRQPPTGGGSTQRLPDPFPGTSELATLCRAHDWSATPLGPVPDWPASLRTAAGLVLSAPVGMIILWGPDFVMLYNDAYRQVMGAKHPRGLGQSVRECWPEAWDFTGPICEGVLRHGESFTFTDQLLILERNGVPEETFFTLSYSAIPDDHGGIGGVLATVFETTEQVRARDMEEREHRQLLAAREAQYHVLFDSIDAGFCVIEVIFDDGRPVDYRFLETNPAFVRLTGLANALGRTVRELLPAQERYWFDLYGKIALTGEPLRVEAPAEALGRWFDVYAFRVGDPEQRRVAVLFNDITDRKRADAERERLLIDAEAARTEAECAQAEAESANRAKGEFLAVMSHELRTPLNAIAGYAELIELGLRGPVTDQQRADLARIQASQRHLLGLINQVLNYTRIDAGAVRYDITDVPVGEALAAAEALVIPQVRARGLTYLMGGCAPDLVVRADREKLQQILLNLLSNAIKFTDAGGEVRVTCSDRGDTVAIAIADTGIGIAPDKLSNIFEPFMQVDQRHTRPHEGVGLGLAISRDLARGMGGEIVAASAPGRGSVFTLTVPRVQPAAHEPAQPRLARAPAAG